MKQEEEAQVHQRPQRSSLNSLRGVLPSRIWRDFTPLLEKERGNEMRFYVRGCSNLETLTRDEQKTLCKKFVEPLLWSQVLFHSGDDMSQKIKRIEETFETLQPMFARKIQFLDMRIMKDEGKVEWQ